VHPDQAKIQQGFWFNDPIVTGYQSNGKVEWITTTERIIEKTFVEQSLGTLFPNKDFDILDVGAAESILSYELASFGYSVTAIDIRPISLFHPNLKFVQCDICEPVFEDNTFDCIIALSTIEHIGLGWYGDEKGDSLDKKAVNAIFKLLKNGGYFILTVPYGKRAETPVHRIYDKYLLNDLLSHFSIVKIQYGLRQDRYTWIVTDEEARVADKEHDPVSLLPSAAALIICKKQ
jgi:SAM-dependent methyltransferase